MGQRKPLSNGISSMTNTSPRLIATCECGIELEQGQEPGDKCRVCRALDASIRRCRRRDLAPRVISPVQSLAEAYARLRAEKTGKPANATDFLDDAKRDLAEAPTRVSLRPQGFNR